MTEAEVKINDEWTEEELNLEADEAIGLQAFIRHVNTLKEVEEETGVNGFTREFVSLRRSDDEYKRQKRFPSTVGAADINRKKNRYKDIIPFDYSRCVLPEVPGKEGSDYINASYLKIGDDVIPAIAAQGPLTTTVDDYWRMVWHYYVRIIIMCVKVIEAGKNKCAKYWPDPGETQAYGDITVTNRNNEEVGNDFNINTLSVTCGGETRELSYFHYTAWPDHGVPKSPQSVLELLRQVRAIQPSLSPPFVVHCSAGCGRTGTIAAIDMLWHMLRHEALEARLDIFETIARFC
jgi:tyrosine-protein phosphatase non-receptor type 12/18/22